MTVLLSLVAVLAGFVLGIIIVLMRIGPCKLLNGFAIAYIELLRGTPLLVQLLLFILDWLSSGLNSANSLPAQSLSR
jgi:polar amino acid transport system substrate-binding protein